MGRKLPLLLLFYFEYTYDLTTTPYYNIIGLKLQVFFNETHFLPKIAVIYQS